MIETNKIKWWTISEILATWYINDMTTNSNPPQKKNKIEGQSQQKYINNWYVKDERNWEGNGRKEIKNN